MNARQSKQQEILTGPLCYRDALRCARYGRKDWICWFEGENRFAARMSYDTLKRAMLANGTKGRDYWMYQGGSGCIWGMHWTLAVSFLANLKAHRYYH